MSNFKELRVWTRSKDLVVEIYRLTSEGFFLKDFGFTSQMRRSALSIPSNIAEGDESGTDKLAKRFFYIAKGSSAELYTQLIIAGEIGYITSETTEKLEEECIALSSMLQKLIIARSK